MRTKYNSKKISHAGYTFDSRGEGDLFDFLKYAEMGGHITDITTQPNVHLTKARILYKPDFKVWNKDLQLHEYYEFKGFETAVWRIKRRLWKYYGPSTLYVYKKNRKGVFLHETIIPKGG